MEQKITSLEKYINDTSETMIIENKFSQNSSYEFIHNNIKYITKSAFREKMYIPLNSNTIILERYDSKIIQHYNNNLCKHIQFHVSNIERLHKNLQMVKCEEFVIIDVDYDCGLENIPKSTKKLSLINLNKNMIRVILSLVKKLNLEYLHVIEIHNSSDLTYINDVLDFNTALKNLNIYNCPNLKNTSLLKKYGTIVNKNN